MTPGSLHEFFQSKQAVVHEDTQDASDTASNWKSLIMQVVRAAHIRTLEQSYSVIEIRNAPVAPIFKVLSENFKKNIFFFKNYIATLFKKNEFRRYFDTVLGKNQGMLSLICLYSKYFWKFSAKGFNVQCLQVRLAYQQYGNVQDLR